MRIGFIVVGAAGYMGQLGLDAIAELRRTRPDLTIDVVAAIDTTENTQRLAALAEKLKGQGYDGGRAPIASLDLGLLAANEYLARLQVSHTDDTRLIAYDASPTTAHADNLRAIAASPLGILYLGEKPAFFDLSDVEYARNAGHRFLCNFMEAANPAFRSAADHLAAEHLALREVWFWRAGDMGLRHVSGRGRRGVEGGSLFDKAVHDVGISVALLDPRRVAGYRIERARIEYLQMYALDPPTFMSMNQDPSPLFEESDIRSALNPDPIGTEVGRDQFPADAAFSLDVRWMQRGPDAETARPVVAHYLSSWLGYLGPKTPAERRMRAKLQALGIGSDVWRDERAHRHAAAGGGTCAYAQQETRIGILECETLRGECVSLVCDFLGSKFGASKPRSCRRVLCRGDTDGVRSRVLYPGTAAHRREETWGYERRALDSLVAIFERAMHQLGDGPEDLDISQCGALWVHDALIAAQEKALLAADFGALKERSLDMFARKVRFSAGP